jgi:hypothetical protein
MGSAVCDLLPRSGAPGRTKRPGRPGCLRLGSAVCISPPAHPHLKPPHPPNPTLRCLHIYLKAFPELIGCSVDALQGNVAKLQKDWKLEGQVLAKAVVRQPAVLGYTIDCMGDCAGECNRCWARF